MITDEEAKKIVLEIDEAKEIIQEIRKESLLYPDWTDCDYTDSFEYVIVDLKHKIDVLAIMEVFV